MCTGTLCLQLFPILSQTYILQDENLESPTPIVTCLHANNCSSNEAKYFPISSKSFYLGVKLQI